MILYALHDAMVKPMPGHPMTPGLAESWNVSPDGFVYEFVKFHNGDAVTAEDVEFSFERYRGTALRFSGTATWTRFWLEQAEGRGKEAGLTHRRSSPQCLTSA